MTSRDTRAHDGTTALVRVRAEGDATGGVDEEAITHVRTKADAALDRPGLPAVGGAVRISGAAARHTEPPWSAGGELPVGCNLVRIHAAHAHELTDRSLDRLRGRPERVLHRGEGGPQLGHTTPWRGGPEGKRPR